jgi:hypothetical protein
MASYSMFNKHHICRTARDKPCRTVTTALKPLSSSLAQWKPPSRSHKSYLRGGNRLRSRVIRFNGCLDLPGQLSWAVAHSSEGKS